MIKPPPLRGRWPSEARSEGGNVAVKLILKHIYNIFTPSVSFADSSPAREEPK